MKNIVTPSKHPVITQRYPENSLNGVMICGINFGWSTEDELAEQSGIQNAPEKPSFFSDETVNNTKFRNRLLRWLRSWGVNLNGMPGQEDVLEKSYFQTNWVDSQTRGVNTEGKINASALVRQEAHCIDAGFSDLGILSLLQERQPRAIVFVGSDLIQAFNDSALRPKVLEILGERSGNAKLVQLKTAYSGKKFRVWHQIFGKTVVLGLPHTQAHGITDEFMGALDLPSEVLAALTVTRACL